MPTSPRRSFIDATSAAPLDVDDAFVAVILDVLGCAGEALSRTPETSVGPGPEHRIPHAASSAEQVTTRSWRVEAASCTVQVERTYYFFPGDVNEPVREYEDIRVEGTRHGGPTVTLHVRVGEREIWIDVDASDQERDEILAGISRTFGRRDP